MDADNAIQLLAEMLFAAIKISAPFLLVTLAVGLLISILQVVTQVQEMTLTFVPKVIAVFAVSIFFGAWCISVMVDLSKRMFEMAGSF
jgi:flagellar biosynthetic protein FliQ